MEATTGISMMLLRSLGSQKHHFTRQMANGGEAAFLI
jgi:hypothetical protein